jgi:NAD(P)-dependent dehydrogenase (short-subunit alcohol dehydrogenase family)
VWQGRHVVVTGGAGALGTAVVTAFADAGAVVHVPVRGASVPATGADLRVQMVGGIDLTDEAAVTAFYAALPDGLWASVHLAGGFAMAPLTETSLADLRGQLDINLVTTFLCCREAVRRFRRRGAGQAQGEQGGRLVNVASRAALQPEKGKAAYSVAKAGVVALTTSLAEELRAEGIAVNAVAPGTIDTAANRAAMPGADATRFVPPDQIADVIVYLASPASRAVSGAIVPVYGRS